jgi:cadmium resistance protein CadD (predicted permease)
MSPRSSRKNRVTVGGLRGLILAALAVAGSEFALDELPGVDVPDELLPLIGLLVLGLRIAEAVMDQAKKGDEPADRNVAGLPK